MSGSTSLLRHSIGLTQHVIEDDDTSSEMSELRTKYFFKATMSFVAAVVSKNCQKLRKKHLARFDYRHTQ